MSRFGRKNNEKGMRLEVLLIKLKVKVVLFFFSKVEFQRDLVSYTMEDKLKKWSFSNNITFEVKDTEIPIYIRGHSFYDIHSTRHCKVLSFSK